MNTEGIETKSKYYIHLFEKIEHLQEFCSNYLYMNNIKNFSKYDDDLINDITEGKVINEKDNANLTYGGLPAGHNISILIPNWFIFCLYELFEGDLVTKGKNIDVTSKKFGQFITSYIGEKEKCFIVLIDADKFDEVIINYLKNKKYYYKRIEFAEYNPAKRMESYLKGDAVSLLFQKRPEYKEKLCEKRLCVFKEEETDFIRLEIKGIDSTIIFKGLIDQAWCKNIRNFDIKK